VTSRKTLRLILHSWGGCGGFSYGLKALLRGVLNLHPLGGEEGEGSPKPKYLSDRRLARPKENLRSIHYMWKLRT